MNWNFLWHQKWLSGLRTYTTKHNNYLLFSKSITIIFKANQIEMRIIFFLSISFANIKLVHKQLTIALERNAKFIEGKHIINAK